MELDNFITIESIIETKLVEKGSVFYCYSSPIQTLDEAHSILENLKAKYYNSTHLCYALKLSDNIVRHSDGGEPSGSAGIKIFNAIQHFNLFNVLVVIIRYFGGTKLGIGLLGKTYYQTAFSNLEKAKIIEKRKYMHLKVKADFEFVGSVYKLASLFDSKIINTSYGNSVDLDMLIRPEKYLIFNEELKNVSNGRIQIQTAEYLFL